MIIVVRLYLSFFIEVAIWVEPVSVGPIDLCITMKLPDVWKDDSSFSDEDTLVLIVFTADMGTQ